MILQHNIYHQLIFSKSKNKKTLAIPGPVCGVLERAALVMPGSLRLKAWPV